MDSECTISLSCETKPNQGVECKGGIANPRRPVVPVLIRFSVVENQCATKCMSETHQFLVPPINSGRLNVGLATTAPAKKSKYDSRHQHKQTCRFIYKKLQCQSAAINSFLPRTIIGGPPDPSIPVVMGALQQTSKKILWKRK